MKLKRFCLRGFAQHERAEIEFLDRTPNLIIGPNEAGKSHLLTALEGTLFGIPDPEPYLPWRGEPVMTGELVFQSGDDLIELRRRFVEQQVEVLQNGTQIYLGRGLVDRNTAEDRRYQQLLIDWIGFAEPDVFRRTVFIGQDLLQDERLSGITSQIKQIITGSQEASYDQALRDLNNELDELKRTGRARKPRRLERLQERRDDVSDRLREAESIQQQVATLNDQLRTFTEQLRAAEETKSRYSELVEHFGRFQDLQKTESDARREWRDLEQRRNELQSRSKRQSELAAELAQLRIPGDPSPEQVIALTRQIGELEPQVRRLRDDVDELRRATQAREEAERELLELQIPGEPDPSEIERVDWELERLERDIPRLEGELARGTSVPTTGTTRHAGRSTSMRVLPLLISGGLIIFGLALGILVDPIFLLAIPVAIVPLAFVLLDVVRSGRGSSAVQNQEQVSDLAKELQSARETQHELSRRRDSWLRETGLHSLQQVAERAREYERIRSRLDDSQPDDGESPLGQLPQAEKALAGLYARRDSVLEETGELDLDALHSRAVKYRGVVRLLSEFEEPDPDELKRIDDRVHTLTQDAAMARAQQEQMLNAYPEIAEIPAERIAEYRRAVERAKTENEDASRQIQEIELERRHLRRGSDDAAALAQERAELDEQIAHIELLADAHELAISALRESVEEFQENALEPVGDDASGHFARMTDGRYRTVQLDRETMTPVVYGDGRHEQIAFDRLSRGTKDQLYLAIRASLIDALSGDRNLPIIFDDPCVNFDEERLALAARVITELARDRQVLLFSKDEIWTRWFSPVLRLERSTAI